MNDTSRMNILQAAKHLIDQKLYVVICQTLSSDDIVQVSAHQVSNEIDLLEQLQGVTMIKRIQKPDYVLVIHVLEQSQFTKSTLGMSCRLKRAIQLFNGHFCTSKIVDCRTESR